MQLDSTPPIFRELDRVNLRPSGNTFAEIDAARSSRPGNVSRNTWIAEAIAEKLGRDRVNGAARKTGRRAVG
jgi:hypothetical protein